jgi:hypothetical protein
VLRISNEEVLRSYAIEEIVITQSSEGVADHCNCDGAAVLRIRRIDLIWGGSPLLVLMAVLIDHAQLLRPRACLSSIVNTPFLISKYLSLIPERHLFFPFFLSFLNLVVHVNASSCPHQHPLTHKTFSHNIITYLDLTARPVLPLVAILRVFDAF